MIKWTIWKIMEYLIDNFFLDIIIKILLTNICFIYIVKNWMTRWNCSYLKNSDSYLRNIDKLYFLVNKIIDYLIDDFLWYCYFLSIFRV